MGIQPPGDTSWSTFKAIIPGVGLRRGEGRLQGSLGLGPQWGRPPHIPTGRGSTWSSSPLRRQGQAVTSLGRSLMPCHPAPSSGLALS